MKHVVVVANDTTVGYIFRKEIIMGLISSGYKVTFIGEPLLFSRNLESLGCQVLPVDTRRHGKNAFRDMMLFYRYYILLRRCAPDVVLTFNIKPNVYAGMACRMLGIPYYPNITGLGSPLSYPGFLQRLTILLYRIGIKKAPAVFFQNADNERFFYNNKLLSASTESILLPGSGVNLEQHSLEPYPGECEKLLFLVVGRIMRDKGTDEILYAAKKIKQEYPNVTFRFLGEHDGGYEQKIMEAARQGIIEYAGRVVDVHSHMKQCHAIVHASYFEGMANVLLECAACGRPIIATNIPGCIETFDEGVFGISCKVKDGDSLASAIRKFIELPYAEKEQMGLAGRAKVQKCFDRQIVVNKYLETIEKNKVEIRL